jgi:hypothetical protein
MSCSTRLAGLKTQFLRRVTASTFWGDWMGGLSQQQQQRGRAIRSTASIVNVEHT